MTLFNLEERNKFPLKLTAYYHCYVVINVRVICSSFFDGQVNIECVIVMSCRAFWLIQEMNKYGYLLSKEMAVCLISCYQPPVTQ